MLAHRLFIALTSLSMIFLAQELALSQEVPRLRQGMPYAQARQLIINTGWQARYISPQEREEINPYTPDYLEYMVEELNYHELMFCSPTGLGLCQFEFVASDGRKLHILTANNECLTRTRCPVQPVILNQWRID